MLKNCLYCGAPFEGAAQARFCSNAHRVAYSRTRTKEPVQGEAVQAEPVRRLTPVEEQQIRDELGYAKSETRTKAERDAAAKRMVERMGGLKPLDPRAFPARPNDLIPSPQKLDRLHRS